MAGPVGTAIGVVAGALIVGIGLDVAVHGLIHWASRWDADDEDADGERSTPKKAKARSRGAKPNNCPQGTMPISETPWSEWHEDIKQGVGNGPADWTGITPDGDVITAGPDGKAVNHGPAQDFTPK